MSGPSLGHADVRSLVCAPGHHGLIAASDRREDSGSRGRTPRADAGEDLRESDVNTSPSSPADEIGGELGQALLPVGGGLIGKFLFGNVRREWARNASVALRAAVRAAGISREDLAEELEARPRLVPLYLQVLWAAGMNGHDRTLRAMGQVLGSAVRAAPDDEDSLEDAEAALQAMGSLTVRHFRVLGALEDAPSRAPKGSGTNYSEATAEALAERLGMRQERVSQALVNLSAAGLAESLNVYGGLAYPITSLGRAVLRAAEAVDELD